MLLPVDLEPLFSHQGPPPSCLPISPPTNPCPFHRPALGHTPIHSHPHHGDTQHLPGRPTRHVRRSFTRHTSKHPTLHPPGPTNRLKCGCSSSARPAQARAPNPRVFLKHYSFSVLSAGDVLRSHIQRQTDIGKRADAVIKQGGLMPVQVMMDLIGAEVQSLASSDWLLDGFRAQWVRRRCSTRCSKSKAKVCGWSST